MRVRVSRTRDRFGVGVVELPLGVVAAVFEEDEAGGGGDSMTVPEGDIDEPHRVDIRHHSLANGEDQELPE